MKTLSKTQIIAPALVALYLILQSAGLVQAKTISSDSLDSLKNAGGKATASAFQHHIFHTQKRNHYRLAVANAGTEPTTLRVYDAQGEIVHRAKMAHDTIVADLDVTLLQPGNYVVKINSGDNVAEERFTVE